MPSDFPQAEEHRDPRDGTAAFSPVSDAMMDHAAHEAAALADGIAHHATTPEEAVGAPTPDATAPTPDVGTDGAEEAIAATDDAPEDIAAVPTPASDDAGLADDHDADAVRDAPPADALHRYGVRVIEMARANAAAATALLTALVQAKSLPEALALNADHLRRQMETLADQGTELASLAQRAALDALQPFKGSKDR